MSDFELWLLGVTYPAWRNRWLLIGAALGVTPFVALAVAKVFARETDWPEVLQ